MHNATADGPEALISDYLSSHSIRKLQLGSGPAPLPGWLNTDIKPTNGQSMYMDVTRPFPFANDTFDYVFTEHMIEHLSYVDALFMLKECWRVMRDGAVVRIATPNLSALAALLGPSLASVQLRYIQWIAETFLPAQFRSSACHVINNAFHNWGHKFIYDLETLADLLERSGFGEIAERPVGHSGDCHLIGLESHGKIIRDEELNAYETMVLEAKRRSLDSSACDLGPPQLAKVDI